MRVNVILHRTAELEDWEEKVRGTLEGKVEPLELRFTYVSRCFDVLSGLDELADMNVVVLAPKKEYIPATGPLILELLKRGVKVFFGTYDEMPSLREDFVKYLESLLGVKETDKKKESII